MISKALERFTNRINGNVIDIRVGNSTYIEHINKSPAKLYTLYYLTFELSVHGQSALLLLALKLLF